MIKAKDSWLCMSCGHLESISPESVALVSKKQSSAKAISQDLSAPSPNSKPEMPKADKPTEPEVEKKSILKAEVAEVLQTEAAAKSEKPLAPQSIQDNNANPKSADMPTDAPGKTNTKGETSSSVAPSAGELHHLQSVAAPSPAQSPSIKQDVANPESLVKVANKTHPAPQTSAPVVEAEPVKASLTLTATSEPTLAELTKTPDVETKKPELVQPTEPEDKATNISTPIPEKSEPTVVVEAEPSEPVAPSPIAPNSSAKPTPLPAVEAPVTVTPPPVPEIAPAAAPIKTFAPETHPGPVNVGLVIWIIVALISFIALVVFGYAFYKGIDLFAGFRK